MEPATLPIKLPHPNTLSSPISVHFLKGNAMIAPSKRKGGPEESDPSAGTNGDDTSGKDYVVLLICLIRLGEPYTTDLVITLNVPDKITDEDVAG